MDLQVKESALALLERVCKVYPVEFRCGTPEVEDWAAAMVQEGGTPEAEAEAWAAAMVEEWAVLVFRLPWATRTAPAHWKVPEWAG